MNALTLEPRRWYSWDFTIHEGGRQVADLDLSAWREKATLTIDGVEYRVYRERLMSGDFVLERGSTILARATKPSAFWNTFIVHYQGREHTLRKASVWRRTFLLEDHGREIGRIVPHSMWRRDGTATLPADWPLPVRTFVIWLAIILWKRDADSAAAAGA
jgi:hypothetical protein